jgi:uncharacterized damage-inducible protein DinB
VKEYLLNTFRYNDWANKQLLDAVNTLSEKEDAIKLFSHLITAQDKWFNRIVKEKDDSAFAWSEPVFPEQDLAERWQQSVAKWIQFVENHTESELEKDIIFSRVSDGKSMSVSIKDVMLQLNYHAIHHRAQINTLLSKQGVKVPATDYVFTALKEMH